MKNISFFLGILISIILGLGVFIVVFLIGINLLNHIYLVLAVSLLISFILNYLLLKLIYYWTKHKKKGTPFYISLIPVLFIVVIWMICFIPNVDLSNAKPKIVLKGEQLKFWNLSTGSKIGYFHIQPDSLKTERPIVFLHGGPGGGISTSDFNFFNELAHHGFQIYLFDQAGVGYSDRLKTEYYTVDRMVEDLEAIRKQINTDKLILVGQSWGSILASKYGVKFPDHVDKIILTSAGNYVDESFYEEDSIPNGAKSPLDELSISDGPTLQMILSNILAGIDDYKIVDSYISQLELDILINDVFDVANYDKKMAINSSCKNIDINKIEVDSLRFNSFNGLANFRINYDLYDKNDTLDTRNELSKIKVPVLLIRGEYDYGSYNAAKDYVDRIPNSKMVIIKDGIHNLWSSETIVNELQTLFISFIEDDSRLSRIAE